MSSQASVYPTELRRILSEEIPRTVTQRQIAAVAGIHESQLSRIANGLHCDDATREAIARALGRETSEVFPG